MASRLTRNAVALLGAQTAGRAVRLLYLVVIARLLEPSAVGIYAYGMALYLSLMVLATFGQGLLLSTRTRRRARFIQSVLVNSLAVRAASASAATIAGAALVWLLDAEQGFVLPALLFVVTILPRSLVHAVRDVYVARELAYWIPRYELCFRGLEASIGSALLVAGHGIEAVASVHLGIYCLEAGLCWRRLLRDPEIAMRWLPSWRMARAIAAISILFMAGIGLLNLYGQLGVLLLKLWRVDIAGVGQFGIAMQLLTTILIAPTAFGSALVPAIIRVRHGGGQRELDALTTVVKLALLTGLAIALLTAACAPALVPLVLGPRFLPAAELFTMLSWATGPYAAAIVVCQSLNALDRRRQATAIALAMNVSLVLSLAVLAPGGAVTAAAISVIASSSVGFVVGIHALGASLGIAGHRWWSIPAALTFAAFLAVRVAGAPGPEAALAVLACVAAVSILSRLVRAEEALFISERLGLRPFRLR